MQVESRGSFSSEPGDSAPRDVAPADYSGNGKGPTRLSRTEFAVLLERSRPALTLVAGAVLGDRVEADDVVQEASVIGLASLDRFTPGTSFEGWMAQIVRNVGRNALRKRMRNPAAPGGQETLETTAASGRAPAKEQAAVSADGRRMNPASFDERVRKALDSLEETSRVCLLLRTVGQLSYTQIAAITDLNENTAMSHVFRARRSLRELLAEHDDRTRSGGAQR
jgi:RNA polymerase sigma-70 factor (ECF subfamily)